jgi:hypothetical protein
VPRLRLVPDNFAGTSLFEALGRALMGFQFGHFSSLVGMGLVARPKDFKAQGFPDAFETLSSIPQGRIWRHGAIVAAPGSIEAIQTRFFDL